METLEPLLTSKEAMRFLRVSENKLYRMLRDGELVGSKVGHQWRFTREQIAGAVRRIPFLTIET